MTAFDTFYTHGEGGSQREIIPLSFYSILPHVVTGEILSGGGGGEGAALGSQQKAEPPRSLATMSPVQRNHASFF